MPFSAQETWYWHGDVSADNVVMSGVKCSGTEMSLAHCRHDGADVSCPRGGGRFGAGVSCSESEYLGFYFILAISVLPELWCGPGHALEVSKQQQIVADGAE